MTGRKADGMTSKTQASIGMLNTAHAENGGCSCPDPCDFWHAAAAAQAGKPVDVMVAFPKSVSVMWAALRKITRR
jgi:hypothetical protein